MPTPPPRAEELGGEVLVPPFDAPWVRMTIRDPQGATFVASQFVPENKDLGASRGIPAAWRTDRRPIHREELCGYS